MLAERKKKTSREVTLLLLSRHTPHTKTTSPVAMAPSAKPRLRSKTNVGVDSSKREKKPIILAGGNGEGIMGEHNNNNNKQH